MLWFEIWVLRTSEPNTVAMTRYEADGVVCILTRFKCNFDMISMFLLLMAVVVAALFPFFDSMSNSFDVCSICCGH